MDGTERPLTSEEQTVVTLIPDGIISYATSDYSLDGEVWNLRLTKLSQASQMTGLSSSTVDLTIEFRDVCWDSALEPASFSNTEFEFTRW